VCSQLLATLLRIGFFGGDQRHVGGGEARKREADIGSVSRSHCEAQSAEAIRPLPGSVVAGCHRHVTLRRRSPQRAPWTRAAHLTSTTTIFCCLIGADWLRARLFWFRSPLWFRLFVLEPGEVCTRSGRRLQSIADTGLGDQQAGAGGVAFQLVAQLGHVDPEVVGLVGVVRSPDFV
jgi:hypothetical protein